MRKLVDWIFRRRRDSKPQVAKQEFVIDLREVSSQDSFQRELTRHFDLPADHVLMWNALSQKLTTLCKSPVRLKFVGWADFRRRMPKYADRLVHFIDVRHRMQELLGGFRLEVEYA
jgi:RNAse (barnase) inhibitor barstar